MRSGRLAMATGSPVGGVTVTGNEPLFVVKVSGVWLLEACSRAAHPAARSVPAMVRAARRLVMEDNALPRVGRHSGADPGLSPRGRRIPAPGAVGVDAAGRRP